MNGAISSNYIPSGVQGACSTGCHVPSDAEWTILTDYLGCTSTTGGLMKETGTTHWASPNFGATNESGFTGLPGGYRSYFGNFSSWLINGDWWSTTKYDSFKAWQRFLSNNTLDLYRNNSDLCFGFSVRCIKD